MEIELHKKIHDKVTELREYQSHAEKTLELKDIQLKHKENLKSYYQKWMEDQAQSLTDATTDAFKAGKLPKVVNGGVSILPSINMRPNLLRIPIMENLEEVNTIINQQQDGKDCRNTVEILEKKLYVETKKKIKKCPFCYETFTTRSLKNKHIDQAHEGIKYFMCPDCGHRYTESAKLKSHIQDIHEGKRLHVCAVCGKNFAGVSCLKQHISAMHGKMNLRPQ